MGRLGESVIKVMAVVHTIMLGVEVLLTILSHYFAGISPMKPAFKEFVINPVCNCFGEIHSITPTKWGKNRTLSYK